MDVGNFDRQTRAVHRQVVAEATETIRSAALQIYSDLQAPALESSGHGSPIASGRFAASMRLSINRLDTSHEPADPDYVYDRPPPPRTIRNTPVSAIAAKLRTFKLGDTIYISNTVPYVRRIEIAGWSWQAPGGVFRPTIERAVRRFRSTLVRLRVTNV